MSETNQPTAEEKTHDLPRPELRHDPMPDAARALRNCTDAILARWRAAVCDALPRADELTRAQLDNSIPELLQQLADALQAGTPAATSRLFAEAPAHGETRFHQSFNISELMIDYQLLRRTIIVQLTEELGRDLGMREALAVNSGIDLAMSRATVAFCRQMAGQLTAEADMLSKYLSFLSHDLRGGLNSSILMIEVLKRELQTEERFAEPLADLDIMRRSMLDTAATMDRFLHAERLRRGKMVIKSAELDLHELLHQVVRSTGFQIVDKNTLVTTSIDCPQRIRGDRDAMMIILQNLLSNAIKYADGKPIELRATTREDGGVRISVIDHGPGIAEDRMATLFAPFTRGETYGKKGVGLGLAIARQIAELLGGTLTADSKPGSGAAFHLDLPATEPA